MALDSSNSSQLLIANQKQKTFVGKERKRCGIYSTKRATAGTVSDNPALTQSIHQRLGQNAPRRISRAEKQNPVGAGFTVHLDYRSLVRRAR